ncbi:MAG: hypothetical protein NWE98_00390 [Candidatus Bathyarchaeota archaeon]|nr:hypothetical protein [Candidatus Bathyarchaeota archaeon]
MPVPEAYYRFVMDYAPYLYVKPGEGPDAQWGKAAFSAGFAVDFLYEAYFDPQFDDRSTEIEAKIVELADWMLTQQVTDNQNVAYGGFISTENSTTCYSVDVGRTVPALLKAYELTSNMRYLNSAKLATGTFLFNMQQKPAALGIHDRFYGGFARAGDTSGVWQPQMDVESLYNLIALGMLRESDPAGERTYQTMIEDAVNFYRVGIEGLNLYFDPAPSGDGSWHRVGLGDDVIYDDSVAYALLGLYEYEGYSGTVQKTYQAINAIEASPHYPAYNPGICWAGYINVKAKTVACDYYDAVAAGILAKIRRSHDKPACDFSAKTIKAHAEEFMFWGTKHATFAPVENKQAMATVCWLGQLLLDYEPPLTRFTQVLNSKGEKLTLYPVTQMGDVPAYGEAVELKAIVLQSKMEEVFIEPGYLINDYLVLHVFAPIRRQDKVVCNGVAYEVTSIRDFMFRNDVAFRKAVLRRLHGQ